MNIPILRLFFPDESRTFLASTIDEVIRSGVLTGGRYTQQFEEMFAAFTGARHAVACSCGTSALELILRGLGVEGKSVIVPTNTFLATAFAAMHAGNRVIFADSDPATLALDVNDVRRRLEDDTAAVILVHAGGVITPAVYDLRKLCDDRHLYLIEDAAHAHGCSIDGQQSGTLGIAGAFSFFPTKVLTTGEGGAITTNDDGLAREIRMLRNHGKNPELGNRMSRFGYNHRMSEITAVLAVDQMRRAPQLIRDRQRAAMFYNAELKQVEGVTPLTLAPNVTSTYYKYVVYFDDRVERAEVKSAMREQFNVALTGEVYADLCHTEPLWQDVTYCGRLRKGGSPSCQCWPRCGRRQDDFAGSERLSRSHACLPIYPGMTDEELGHVVTSLHRVLTASIARLSCA